MDQKNKIHEIVERIKKSLPAQAPLKDFIATNTLSAFQEFPFHEGLKEASRKLGIKPYLEISEYQALLNEGKIKKEVLDWVIKKSGLSSNDLDLEPPKKPDSKKRIRDLWKSQYEIDLITHVHPMFFRHVGHFLDQGISFSPVPFSDLGFWQALQDLERFSIFSLFKGKKLGLAHRLLSQDPWQAINEALQVLVGSEAFFETYLFEMVQEHPGWSGTNQKESSCSSTS